MKLGICIGVQQDIEKPVIDISLISDLKTIGYDYIELPLAPVAALSEERFAELRSLLEKSDLPVEVCNVFFPGTLRLTGENADHDSAVEYVKTACDRAARIGTKIIVLGSAGAKNLPEGFPYEKGRQQFVNLLHRIQQIAAPLDISIAVEPLNTKESNFITSVKEGYEIVKSVSESHIRLLADYYHMAREKEDLSILAEVGDMLTHIHIASEENRRYPKPEDPDDYVALASFLREGGYTGRISIEGSSDDIQADAAVSFPVLQNLFR